IYYSQTILCLSCMNPMLTLALVLFTGSAASVDTVLKIVATAGETVLLPCITTASNDVPPVEWTKQGTHSSSVIAFLYRDGCETFEMKDPVFRYKTNLIMHELHHGNLSMLMSNVQPNDSGIYQCVIPNKKKQVITTLELWTISCEHLGEVIF
uniref:Ig-like domain-containing protein n=1 Tax=Amphilophus citrinellus TaxID=61819 RepID=A0A3Q0TCR8_AMPCI